MDIYLDDISSLHLLRYVSATPSLTLVATQMHSPTALSASPVRLSRLGLINLLSYLRVPEEGDLSIVVPSASNRVRAKGIQCQVMSRLPANATFLMLANADPRNPNPIVPDQARVFVQPAECVALGMAARLAKRVGEGSMERTTAVLMLVKLCLELCGTYAHDPFYPNSGSVTYDTRPHTCTKRLQEFSSNLRGERGSALLRETSQLVYDLSGSPQESFLGPALFFQAKLGGLGLGSFEANAPLDLSPAQLATIKCQRITPDFTIEPYGILVEYLGGVHEEGDNPSLDHARELDYQTLGRRVFSFVYEDVRTQADFMRSARRIVAAIQQYEGARIRKRFNRLSRDPVFMQRQYKLFQVFRPWLR